MGWDDTLKTVEERKRKGEQLLSAGAFEQAKLALEQACEALEELWSNAYCVVQPSTMEGLSIALLEALSYGRCVLVSDIPENMEVAEECALSFRSKDVDDLRSKLAHLISHPEEVERYGARARAHIAQHYSWDNVAESTARLYEDVSGKPR